MIQALLIIHLIIAIVLIGLILLQKTEGGAAGAGFSVTAAVNSMMQPRPRANPLSQATAILGICFFATSIGLALLARPQTQAISIFDQAPAKNGPSVPKVDESLPAVPGPSGPADSPAPGTPSVPNN